MEEIQEKVDEMIKKYSLESPVDVRYIDLVSEVGELGKEILKGNNYGNTEFSMTDNMQLEIGDVLFSLTCIANGLGISLNEAFEEVMKKYETRFSKKGNIGSEN